MNCEQVKDLLSAYLDNMLALDERAAVTSHLQSCAVCHDILEDYYHFDTLLAQLPRVAPAPLLRNKIFTSPEYLGLTGSTGRNFGWNEHALPSAHQEKKGPSSHPHLVAIPGGRQSSSFSPTVPHPSIRYRARSRHPFHGLRILQAAIAACFLLTLAMSGFIYWNIVREQRAASTASSGFTVPAAPQQGPIPAGTRFVFLRDGALWSAPDDGTSEIMRLSPDHITVANNWVVRPALPARSAGNMLAYIDLQQGKAHIIRSDGQNDTELQPSLLKQGLQPTSVWDTSLGNTILNSLTWSQDGSMLAFVADPSGSGQLSLYIYSLTTGNTQMVPLPTAGSVSHPTWSPDSIRIAFEFTSKGKTSILDYNTQNHGLLTIVASANTSTYPGDTIQTLDWSPEVTLPTLTWSIGTPQQIHNIWVQQVGTINMTQPTQLIAGIYNQAIYSRNGNAGAGSWLLLDTHSTNISTIINLGLNGALAQYAYNKQASLVQWSPDGNHITYFEAYAHELGTLHMITIATGNDVVIKTNITNDPSPVWSPDGRYLAYSTGAQIMVNDVQTMNAAKQLKIQGMINALSWSATAPYNLVLACSDIQQGIYLADIQHGTFQHLDKKDLTGPIQWTQIP
jgi:Tol biopolymer transport system component